MDKRFMLLLLVLAVSVVVAVAGQGTKPLGIQVPVEAPEGVVHQHVSVPPLREPATDRPMVGTYTTLGGYYDYQCNGGACQHIRVNPANGNVHVTFMLSDDSLSISPSRRVGYAFSTNAGATWNNFNNLRVPARRAGFPTLDLLQGSTAGLPVIANHNETTPGLLTSALYVDSPEGAGAFSELNNPPIIASSDEPIWPYVANPSDGSIVIHASRQTAATNHLTRTSDFATWSPWTSFPGTNSAGGRYSTHANGTGRVATLLNAVGNGVYLLESTDNGQTWPTLAITVHEAQRIAGADTFQAWVGSDIVYDGNTPLVAINEINIGANEPTDGAQIVFWTQSGGYRVAATRFNTPGVATLNRTQVNHFSMGYPAIGMSGSRIVIVYMGFMAETSAVGFNYGDIFYVQSTNGGVTWSTPVNITNTPNLDERYPSISKYNPAGFAYITWQEDPQPGSSAFNDNAPLSRARQVFYKLSLTTDVGSESSLPQQFSLSQNYPNPFNPATKIDYTVAKAGQVSIKVYNTLGQEIATLVNEHLAPGHYQTLFDGTNLPSGLYIYKMTAGGFTQARRMLLIK
jgi:hypothetical protein